MRLSTIWTLRGMSLRERLNRTAELALIKIAHRMPRRLAYRVYIDVGVRNIRSDEVIPEVTYMDILQRADR